MHSGALEVFHAQRISTHRCDAYGRCGDGDVSAGLGPGSAYMEEMHLGGEGDADEDMYFL